jgi:hypothetical protein
VATGPGGSPDPAERLAAASVGCPRALTPGPRAAEHAVAAVRAHLASALHGVDVHGADVIAAFSLDPAVRPPGLRVARYIGRPTRACGATVVHRSWAVVVTVPQARAATLQPAVVYAARTQHGWQPWYAAFPSAGTGGPVSSASRPTP